MQANKKQAAAMEQAVERGLVRRLLGQGKLSAAVAAQLLERL